MISSDPLPRNVIGDSGVDSISHTNDINPPGESTVIVKIVFLPISVVFIILSRWETVRRIMFLIHTEKLSHPRELEVKVE